MMTSTYTNTNANSQTDNRKGKQTSNQPSAARRGDRKPSVQKLTNGNSSVSFAQQDNDDDAGLNMSDIEVRTML